MGSYWSVISGFSRSFTVPFIDVMYKERGPLANALWEMLLHASQDAFFVSVVFLVWLHRS